MDKFDKTQLKSCKACALHFEKLQSWSLAKVEMTGNRAAFTHYGLAII